MLKFLCGLIGLVIGMFIGLSVFLFLPDAPGTIMGPSWSTISRDAKDAPASSNEIEKNRMEGLKLIATSAIQSMLNDPYSAKFSDLNVRSVEKGQLVVCGSVNAKNGFGAYVGSTPFVYEHLINMGMLATKGDEPEARYARNAVAKYCN